MQPIGDLLTRPETLSLPTSASTLEAARAMQSAGVGAVLVLADDGSLAGIFTERDLMVRVVVEGKDPGATRVGDVMSRSLYTAAPTERASAVREEMHRRHIRHVPVVAEGRVLGVLSLRDLLRHDLQVKTQEVEAITSYIQGGLPTDDAPPA